MNSSNTFHIIEEPIHHYFILSQLLERLGCPQIFGNHWLHLFFFFFYRAKIKPEVVDNRDISQSLSGTVFAPCLFAQSIISRKPNRNSTVGRTIRFVTSLSLSSLSHYPSLFTAISSTE